MTHKIMFTLPIPANAEEANKIETQANRMMQRLGDTDGHTFVWNDDDKVWEWSGRMGSNALVCGQIEFNLDYLGRPE
jgi:hypothetical protein